MKKNIGKFIFIISAGLILFSASYVFTAQDNSFGIDQAAKTSGLLNNKISLSGGIPNLIGNLVAVVLALVGVYFFILILFAGIQWMTAAGSAEKVSKAKEKLMSASIGLVIVLSAYMISNFIFTKFLSSNESTSNNCTNLADGTNCGNLQSCSSGKCVSDCNYQYSSGNCITHSECTGEDRTPVPGLCPEEEDKQNVYCCVSTEEYTNQALSQ